MSATQVQSCTKCGQRLAVNAKFCVNCGTSTSGIFSGGGSSTVAVQQDQSQDTLFPILQDETLGDYDLYGELGRGGMAAVYLALDLALNRKVAIKTMLPELISREGMVQRFKREAQTAAALSHPHIVQIFSVKETKRLVYFVMKYIEGRSLESVIVERGQLDLDLTRVILAQAGSALAFANRKGVVHRDVKPANIMLEEDGWAIVTDFGIAKVQEAQNLTATGTAIGTPHYMSPEQFHNKAVTGASDQYSFGVVAYEMLTGKKPFDGATYAEIITQHLFDPVPDVRILRPDVPAFVAETIARMLSKEAKDRFPDIDAAVAALGSPSQTQVDAGRTQMISIAKSGADKRPSMSVPLSPVPAGKRVSGTAVEAGKARPSQTQASQRPSAQTSKKKSSSRVWLGVAAVVLILILASGAAFLNKDRLLGTPAAPVGAASLTAATPKDSAHVALAGTATPPGSVPPAASASAPLAATDSAARVKAAGGASDPKTKRGGQDGAKAPGRASVGGAAVQGGGSKSVVAQGRKADSVPKTAAKDSAVGARSGGSSASKEDLPPIKPSQIVAPTIAAAEPPPLPNGSIRISSPTPGATLWVDGKQIATLTTVPANFSVAAGSRHIEIQATGCVEFDTTLTVESSKTNPQFRRSPTCK